MTSCHDFTHMAKACVLPSKKCSKNFGNRNRHGVIYTRKKKLPKTPETAWSKDKHKGWERKKKKD